MSARPIRFLALFLAVPLLLLGCPSDDDDTADDDDSSVVADDDDVVDDDDAGDDDAGDDDDDLVDYVAATVPDFAGCAGNQFMLMLGDGTEIGPFDGHVAEASFANNFPQFTIRTGPTTSWTQLNGNYTGMQAGAAIPFQGPSSTAGNVVLQALLDASAIGASPVDLAGTYGEPPNNLHPDVGGSVTFDAVPGPNLETSGTYEGIIQKIVSLTDQQILLGVRGCFVATLAPTD